MYQTKLLFLLPITGTGTEKYGPITVKSEIKTEIKSELNTSIKSELNDTVKSELDSESEYSSEYNESSLDFNESLDFEDKKVGEDFFGSSYEWIPPCKCFPPGVSEPDCGPVYGHLGNYPNF